MASRHFSVETLRDLILMRSRSRRTWLILPDDPLRTDAARRLTFEDVYSESARVARAFHILGARDSGVVGLVSNNSPDFVHLLFGALLAGLVPAPLHLPYFAPRWEEYVGRVKSVLRDSEAQFLVAGDDFESLVQEMSGERFTSLCCTSLRDQGPHGENVRLREAFESPAGTALIQFSSGSTRAPVGIELSHGNVLSNVDGIGRAVGADENHDVALCWLPLFHDMGLTGTLLYSWYWGLPLVLMSPQDFIARPASWLWAISRFGVTGCAAPNFAYALCSAPSKVPDKVLEGLDLKTWRVAFNGAEPVQEATVRSFVGRFQRHGFRPESMYPVYGLAENTVACCFPPYGRPARFDYVERRSLERGRAEPIAAADPGARGVASTGTPLCGGRVRIVGDNGEVADRTVGRIEVSGPSVMKGYYRRPAETAAVLGADRWLNTGDVGYLAEGELYVVGRTKDIIKKAGAKYDAADIQSLVSMVPGVRAGRVAAFAVESPLRGTEQLVIVAETRLTSQEHLNALASSVRAAVARVYSTSTDTVCLVVPNELPRTSSGKVRVQECRQKYLDNELQTVLLERREPR